MTSVTRAPSDSAEETKKVAEPVWTVVLTHRYGEGYVDRTHNRRLARCLLLLCAASLAATPARGVAIVGTTSATFTWTAAPGPVAGYAVFVNRNGTGYPATPNQQVTASQATVSGSYGDTIVIKVAAYDSSNTLGPFSPESASYQFVAAAQLTLSTTSLTGAAVQGQSPATTSFSIQSPSGTVSYALSTGAAWLSVSPASGTASSTPNMITVAMNPTGLSPATYTSTITATATGGAGSPATIGVVFTVSAPAPTTPAPTTPAPTTPAPTTPAPTTPAPTSQRRPRQRRPRQRRPRQHRPPHDHASADHASTNHASTDHASTNHASTERRVRLPQHSGAGDGGFRSGQRGGAGGEVPV